MSPADVSPRPRLPLSSLIPLALAQTLPGGAAKPASWAPAAHLPKMPPPPNDSPSAQAQRAERGSDNAPNGVPRAAANPTRGRAGQIGSAATTLPAAAASSSPESRAAAECESRWQHALCLLLSAVPARGACLQRERTTGGEDGSPCAVFAPSRLPSWAIGAVLPVQALRGPEPH